MENKIKDVSHHGFSPNDREFYIEGAVLAAISAVIAVVAAL